MVCIRGKILFLGRFIMANSAHYFVINTNQPFFIFDSDGNWHATVLNNCIWDAHGRYIGFVRGPEYDVYTAAGEWIGQLMVDGRIIRKRVYERQPELSLKKLRPRRPGNLPPDAPLPPSIAQLRYHYVDVLEWDPQIFERQANHQSDSSAHASQAKAHR
jgi:hypothetical protein